MIFSRKSAFAALLSVLGAFSLAGALPTQLSRRQSSAITPLSDAAVHAFKPYSYYATAGYCKPNATITWSCGLNCASNPDFIPVASGGNGGSVQNWYVGYDPNLEEVIVSHQGTDPDSFVQILEDANFFLKNADDDLFPGLDDDIKMDSGFLDAHSRSANDTLVAVQETMSLYNTRKVTVVGHSLGAALSLLDAVYFPLHIPNVVLRFIGYGLPRVGNQEFANYVDAQPISVTHVNNKRDLVPILPFKWLGYHHPSGEIHIQPNTSQWLACPGQDNNSTLCSTGLLKTLFDGNTTDHGGPYDGVKMGSHTCELV